MLAMGSVVPPRFFGRSNVVPTQERRLVQVSKISAPSFAAVWRGRCVIVAAPPCCSGPEQTSKGTNDRQFAQIWHTAGLVALHLALLEDAIDEHAPALRTCPGVTDEVKSACRLQPPFARVSCGCG